MGEHVEMQSDGVGDVMAATAVYATLRSNWTDVGTSSGVWLHLQRC